MHLTQIYLKKILSTRNVNLICFYLVNIFTFFGKRLNRINSVSCLGYMKTKNIINFIFFLYFALLVKLFK